MKLLAANSVSSKKVRLGCVCRRDALRLLPCVTTLLAASCTTLVESPFDPRGAQVALYGEWDVNSENPAASDACERAGLSVVELAFFEPATGEEFVDDAFRFPCKDGVFESGVAVLRVGSYQYEWRAYETNLVAPVLVSRRYDLTMDRAGEFILQAVDFIREIVP